MADAKAAAADEAAAEKPAEKKGTEVDHVAAVSYDSDGKPAQTPGFKVISE